MKIVPPAETVARHNTSVPTLRLTAESAPEYYGIIQFFRKTENALSLHCDNLNIVLNALHESSRSGGCVQYRARYRT